MAMTRSVRRLRRRIEQLEDYLLGNPASLMASLDDLNRLEIELSEAIADLENLERSHNRQLLPVAR